jgi:predicted regulator of Ras-like GTPase activity (Roadblock/LC7/MglB family)
VTQEESTGDLGWVLDQLTHKVPHVQGAVVLSSDGLRMGSSQGITTEDAEHLAAIAAGIQSLAKGAGERFGGGPIRQTIVELAHAYMLVSVAGTNACLAVLAGEEVDIGMVAYEMTTLVSQLGPHLGTSVRTIAAQGQS